MKKITFISTLVALLLTCEASAQTKSVEDYNRVKRHNFFSMSEGVAGLRINSTSSSFAQIYAQHDNGDFKSAHMSSQSWNFGAEMKSIYHMKRISFSGELKYDNFIGKDMCGSMFLDPGYYPVDIIEFTPGRKSRETYHFKGGVQAPVTDRFLMGVMVDVSAYSYAKRKDLRHKNNAVDFSVLPSLSWKLKKGMVGLTYTFSKKSETINAGEYGISSQIYEAFFDKGLSYGTLQQWEGSGIHLKETGLSGFPVREFNNGAAFQFQYGAFYFDLGYARRSGKTGEKDTILHEFTANDYKANIGANLSKSWNLYASYAFTNQINSENVLHQVTEDGITLNHKEGQNDIFARVMQRADLSVEYYRDSTEVLFGVSYNEMRRTSTLAYPLYKKETLGFIGVFASLRHEFSQKVEISGRISGGYGCRKFQEGELDSSSHLESAYPTYLGTYQDMEKDYYTASRVGIEAGVKYAFYRNFYVALNGGYTRAFSTLLLGCNRGNIKLSIGYKF